MTQIICDAKDCLFNHRETNQCRASVIKIKPRSGILLATNYNCEDYESTPAILEDRIPGNKGS